MKRIRTLVILLLLLSLCACGQKPGGEASSSAGNSGSEGTGLQARPTESPQVEITDPKYVYLPEETDNTGDLVFSEWASEERDGSEPQVPAAKYQDVSDIQNVVAIPSVYGDAGETVTTPLRICGQVELCAFDLRVTYDKNRLKYVGCGNADEDLVIHCREDSGTLLMNFLRISNLKDGFAVCDLQFEVLTTSACDTPLHIEVVEAVSLDETGEIVFCAFSTVDGVAHLNKKGG